MRGFPDCPNTLDASHLRTYNEQGFIAFEHALSKEEVALAKAALSHIVKRAVESPDEFKISGGVGSVSQSGATYKSTHDRLFFQLERGVSPDGMSAEEIETHIRKFMWFEDEAPILSAIYTTHPRTAGPVHDILGSDVVLYQSMALVKPARIGIDKPWHQDNAYFSVRNLDQILGTWIALDDSTVENGCMHFIPGGHRSGPLRHHHTHDCEIVSDRIDTSEAVPIELEAGGIIFFHGNIPHYTPPNRTDSRRRAIQYHYRAAQNEVIPQKAYYEVFREADGTPASCAAATEFGY